MDTFFKAQLPPNITALVDRIETFAGREIAVAVDSRPVSATSPNPDRLVARVDQTAATILLRSKDVFPPHDVLHELLHIERFWVDGIPQLQPVDDRDKALISITSAFENTLEHLVIVPREANYGFDPYPYWNETTRRNWAGYPWPAITETQARRVNCLLFWLTASHLVNDREVKEHVEECLSKEGLLEEAQLFSARISKELSSKPHAISVVVRFLKIPRERVVVLRINVKNGTLDPIPLPLH